MCVYVCVKPLCWLRVQINEEQIEHGRLVMLNCCRIFCYMLLSFPGLWLRREINQPESGDHDQTRLAQSAFQIHYSTLCRVILGKIMFACLLDIDKNMSLKACHVKEANGNVVMVLGSRNHSLLYFFLFISF